MATKNGPTGSEYTRAKGMGKANGTANHFSTVPVSPQLTRHRTRTFTRMYLAPVITVRGIRISANCPCAGLHNSCVEESGKYRPKYFGIIAK